MTLLSVWLALSSLALALTMLVHRPAFSDVLVTITLYSGIIAGTLAGLVLWGTRTRRQEFALARLQAKVAVALAVPAAAIVYLLVAQAQRAPDTLKPLLRLSYNRFAHMRILVNGTPQELVEGWSVSQLVAAHGLQPLRVAVEINTRLLPRRQFDDTVLNDGDRVEIVTLVGGG